MNTEQLHEKVSQAVEGTVPALDVYANLSILKKELDNLISQVKPLALDEAKNESEKTFNRNGVQFSFTNGRANYDFSGDSIYSEYKQVLKQREALMKQASKAWELNNQIVDENGEVVPPAKVTYSADSLSVKLVK